MVIDTENYNNQNRDKSKLRHTELALYNQVRVCLANVGITFVANLFYLYSRGTELSSLPLLPLSLLGAAAGACDPTLADAGVWGRCCCHWMRGVTKAFPSSAMKSCLLKHFPWFQTRSIAINTTYALHASQNQQTHVGLEVYLVPTLSMCHQTHTSPSGLSCPDSGKKSWKLDLIVDIILTMFSSLAQPPLS